MTLYYLSLLAITWLFFCSSPTTAGQLGLCYQTK